MSRATGNTQDSLTGRRQVLGVSLALCGLLLLGSGCDREDNDWAAFDPNAKLLIVQADTLRLDENGEGSEFRVSLQMVPEDTVTVLIRAEDDQIVIEPDSLVFAPVDDQWMGERVISVSALNDERDEGDHTDVLGVLAHSRDLDYDGQGGDLQLPVLITDDDLAAVAVSESLLTLVESLDGLISETYNVALLSQPADSVFVSLTETPSEASLHLEPVSLAFSAENWNIPQQVRIWVELDEIDGDDLDLTLSHETTSNDPNYGPELMIPSVRLLVYDDTLPPVARLNLVYPDESTLYESDAGAMVEVVITIDRQSTQDVVLHLAAVNETATSGLDFMEIDQDVVFTPTDPPSRTFVLEVIDDVILEWPEEFQVVITAVENLLIGDDDRLTIAIEDNDTTELTLSATDADEDGGAAEFVVTIPQTEMVPLEFTFVTEGGTALSGNDFEPMSETFVIEQGQTQQIIPVILLADPDYEPDEIFSARLEGLSRHAAWSQSPVECTILNDDLQTILLSGGAYQESDSNAVFTLNLVAPYNEPVSIYLNALPGDGLGAADGQEDARPGSDFGVMSAAERIIPAGTTVFEIRVPIENDFIAEGTTEYFRLEVAASSHDGFTGLIATSSIDDDDQPCLRVGDLLVNEGDGAATFRIDLIDDGGGPTTSEADIVFRAMTVDQAAEGGVDFVSYDETVTIPAGWNGLDIPISLIDDGHDDDNETFVFVLSEHVNALGNCVEEPAFCRIVDDEYPALSVAPVAADRYNEGSNYEFVARLSTPRQYETTFVMNVAAGTSNGQGIDYLFAGNGPQSIEAFETELFFTVSFLDDQLDGEIDETLQVSVNGANVALGTSSINAVIIDAPVLDISGDTVNEGEFATFTVSMDAPSTSDVVFVVQYASGTATAGLDFSVANDGPFTIPAGDTTFDILVPATAGDGGDAASEEFNVTLITPINATIGPFNSAVGTIFDMDPPELRWAGAASATEGDDIQFVVNLSWPSEVGVQFEVEFTDGTAARAGIDYDDSTVGPFTVPAGTVNYTVPVPTTLDGSPELAAEDFMIRLVSPVEAVIGSPDSAIGYVMDADQPELTIPAGDTSVEGGALYFTIQLSQPTIVPVFFNLEYDDGSTQGVTDFDPTNTGLFSMMPGTTDTTITVLTVDDGDFENEESFIVRLSADAVNAVLGTPFEANGTINDDD